LEIAPSNEDILPWYIGYLSALAGQCYEKVFPYARVVDRQASPLIAVHATDDPGGGLRSAIEIYEGIPHSCRPMLLQIDELESKAGGWYVRILSAEVIPKDSFCTRDCCPPV